MSNVTTSVDDDSSYGAHLVVIDQIIAMARLNPTLVAMRGLPGSGKSLFASRLICRFQHVMFEEYKENRFQSSICSADHFFLSEQHDENGNPLGYRYDPTKIGEAHNYCMRRVLQETSNDGLISQPTRLVVVDNTNTHPIEISPYLLVAGARGYTGVVVEVPVDFETGLARNKHGVGRDAMAGMANNMLSMMPPWWDIKKVVG